MNTRRFKNVQDYNEEIQRLVGLDRKAAALKAALTIERDQVVAELAVRNLGKDFRVLERRRDQLELSLRQLDAGFGRDDGYFPDVADLFPFPGLVAIREQIDTLKAERDQLAADLSFDPRVTRPYRVVPIKPGSPRRAINVYWRFSDVMRKLQPGDVVNLDTRKAADYADFLEPVQEDEAPQASEEVSA